MVMGKEARKDVEHLLTKEITYIRNEGDLVDLSTGEESVVEEQLTIKAQCTINRAARKHHALGKIKDGDLVGLFRYEYTEEADGTTISPKLVPKLRETIVFLGRDWVIQELTPATSEDDVIIGWDFRAEEN